MSDNHKCRLLATLGMCACLLSCVVGQGSAVKSASDTKQDKEADRNGVVYTDKRSTSMPPVEVGMTPYQRVQHKRAAYVDDLRQRGVEGVVVLIHDINKAGRVENARVLFSRPRLVFDRAVLAASEDWIFEPAKRHGVPVVVKNVVMQTTFCVPDHRSHELKEPVCGNPEAAQALNASLARPPQKYVD